MGRLILTLTVLAQFGFAQTVKNDLQGFEDFLGKEKSKSLNALVKSFDKFLQLNYPEFEAGNQRIRQYMLDYDRGNRNYPDSAPNWIFDYDGISRTLKQLEESGMRKEIWLYGYEKHNYTYSLEDFFQEPETDTNTKELGSLIIEDLEEEIIPIWADEMDSLEFQRRLEVSERRLDSIPFDNINGQFLYGLAKFSSTDTTIQGFLEAINIIGGFPPFGITDVDNLLEADFDEPFMKRLIVADTYCFIINAENKKKK